MATIIKKYIISISSVEHYAYSKQKISGKKQLKLSCSQQKKQNHLFIFQTSTSQFLHTSILALFGRSGKFYWSFSVPFGGFPLQLFNEGDSAPQQRQQQQRASQHVSVFPPKCSNHFFKNKKKHREGSPGTKCMLKCCLSSADAPSWTALPWLVAPWGKWRCVRLQPLRYPESQLCCLPASVGWSEGWNGTHTRLVGWLVGWIVCWR